MSTMIDRMVKKVLVYLLTLSIAHGQIQVSIKTTVKEIKSCLSNERSHDQHLPNKTFDCDPDTFCSPHTSGFNVRINGITCCFPMSPEQIRLLLHVYLPSSNATYLDLKFSDESGKELFLKYQKIGIYYHGILEQPLNENYIQVLRQYFNSQGCPFIVVDYSGGNQLQLFQTNANARVVGAAVGYSIVHWNIVSKVKLIGFSLGGQIIGFTGKYVTETTGHKIKECISLDPSGPLFQGAPNVAKLVRSDCEVVKVVHTAALIIPEFSFPLAYLIGSLGTGEKSGHCDYWINCGFFQPEPCFGSEGTACSHDRSLLLYINILYGRCNFTAYQCVNCGNRFQKCSKKGSNNPIPFIGELECSKDQNQNYVVYTEPKDSCVSYNLATLTNPLP